MADGLVLITPELSPTGVGIGQDGWNLEVFGNCCDGRLARWNGQFICADCHELKSTCKRGRTMNLTFTSDVVGRWIADWTDLENFTITIHRD